MTETLLWSIMAIVLHVSLQLCLAVRVLLRPNREPASRLAWLAVVTTIPIMGLVAYVIFGEVNIGRRRAMRRRTILKQLSDLPDLLANPRTPDDLSRPADVRQLFNVGQSITGFPPVGGNQAQLMADSNSTIDALVIDIEAATMHVHLLFYIWLEDNNGVRVVEALKRAAHRGVTCRAMVDDVGSRSMIRSSHWSAMRDAGVRLGVSLPVGNPLLRPLKGRIDLRNHRKIAIIDNSVTYCGSQNCADPEFRVKPKYAPWVDVMMRFEGPVVRQNQALFTSDWMARVDEDLTDLLAEPMPDPSPGFAAQVIGTGPTIRFSAMPEMFETLMYTARSELVVTTPYYIPNESIQGALCACARRGIATTVVLPKRNDSWIVAAASRSYYEGLLEAGVRICEYVDGLLHAKTLTVDGRITLIGSANMDRRSFELNYENNILLFDPATTQELYRRQQEFIERSERVTLDEVRNWGLATRLRNNAMATMGPIL